MIKYWRLFIFFCLSLKQFVNANIKQSPTPLHVSVPLNYHKENGYTINLLIGTPPKLVTLILDSYNEGLRYFETNDSNSQKNFFNKFLPKQNIFSSSSLRYCCPGYSCVPPHRYECTLISQRSQDAEFYTYRIAKSKYLKNKFFNEPVTICENRAEATDLVYVDATYFNNSTEPSEIRIKIHNAPVQLVNSIENCTTKTEFKHFSSMQSKQSNNIGGILGLAGQWCRYPTFAALFLGTVGGHWFSLDLDTVKPSLMLYGEEIENDKQPIVWSETPQLNLLNLRGISFFSTYSATLCDIKLGEVVSSHWGALIDLNSPCLGLPEFLWQSVMSWLPIECPISLIKIKTTKPYLCRLQSHVDINRLPSLKFYLSQPTFSNMTKNHGFPENSINISLQELVLENRELCIYCLKASSGVFPPSYQTLSTIDTEKTLNFNTLKMPENPSVLEPAITFGTLVLQQFLIYSSPFNKSIGFKQKKISSLNPAECIPKTQCRGQQTYFPSTNTCLDPLCYKWLFKKLNLQTRECEYSFYVTIIVPLVLISCLIAELFTDFLRLREINQAEKCN